MWINVASGREWSGFLLIPAIFCKIEMRSLAENSQSGQLAKDQQMVQTRKELKVVTAEPVGPEARAPHGRSARKEKPARHHQRGVSTSRK